MVVDNIITINTPVREYQLDNGAVGRHVNIYQEYDPVQAGGGNSINIPDGVISIPMPTGTPLLVPTFGGTKEGTGEMGRAGRTFGGALNIDTPFDRSNVHNTHNTPGMWEDRLRGAIHPRPTEAPILSPVSVEPARRDATYVSPSGP